MAVPGERQHSSCVTEGPVGKVNNKRLNVKTKQDGAVNVHGFVRSHREEGRFKVLHQNCNSDTSTRIQQLDFQFSIATFEWIGVGAAYVRCLIFLFLSFHKNANG